MSARDDDGAIESYLQEVRRNLGGLPEPEVADIVLELRGHIAERAEAEGGRTQPKLDEILAALGNPKEVAGLYVMERLLARAENSRSPWRLLRGLFHWATVSVSGSVVLILSLPGYMIGVPFLLMALAKPIFPDYVGLWVRTDTVPKTLDFGFRFHAVTAQELLGWWIVPLGLVVGVGMIVGTLQFDRWCIRLYQCRLEAARTSLR